MDISESVVATKPDQNSMVVNFNMKSLGQERVVHLTSKWQALTKRNTASKMKEVGGDFLCLYQFRQCECDVSLLFGNKGFFSQWIFAFEGA